MCKRRVRFTVTCLQWHGSEHSGGARQHFMARPRHLSVGRILADSAHPDAADAAHRRRSSLRLSLEGSPLPWEGEGEARSKRHSSSTSTPTLAVCLDRDSPALLNLAEDGKCPEELGALHLGELARLSLRRRNGLQFALFPPQLRPRSPCFLSITFFVMIQSGVRPRWRRTRPAEAAPVCWWQLKGRPPSSFPMTRCSIPHYCVIIIEWYDLRRNWARFRVNMAFPGLAEDLLAVPFSPHYAYRAVLPCIHELLHLFVVLTSLADVRLCRGVRFFGIVASDQGY